jgi:transposase
MALSIDIRKRVVSAYEANEGGFQKIAERFNVGMCSVRRWLTLKKETGDIQKRPRGGGTVVKISDAKLPELISLVQEKPDRTAEELRIEWLKREGGEMGRSSMVRALKRANLSLKKKRSGQLNVTWKKTERNG